MHICPPIWFFSELTFLRDLGEGTALGITRWPHVVYSYYRRVFTDTFTYLTSENNLAYI